jgi:hypothetical protein
MSGFLTAEQRARIAKKVTARREESKAALEWALNNNVCSEGRTADYILACSPDPILVDHGTDAESQNANIERVEEFTAVFPDDTLAKSNGGLTSVKDFNPAVKQAKESNGDCFASSQGSECMDNCKQNDFCKAFPLQFCHGCSGPKDQRSRTINLKDHLQPVINLSQPRFYFSVCVQSYSEADDGRKCNMAFEIQRSCHQQIQTAHTDRC